MVQIGEGELVGGEGLVPGEKSGDRWAGVGDPEAGFL